MGRIVKDEAAHGIFGASGILFNESDDVNYGLAAHVPRKGFTYYDPVKDAGLPEVNVRDMLALPDGRLVLAGPTTGLSIWDPASGTHVNIRAGQGIPDRLGHKRIAGSQEFASGEQCRIDFVGAHLASSLHALLACLHHDDARRRLQS